MRLLIATIASLCLLLVSSVAAAYEMRLDLVSGAPSGATVGDQLVYDIYLDTQSASEIVLFALNVQFDPDVIRYNRPASDAEDYYPLYTPGAKANPPTYLTPIADPFRLWGGDQPANGDQIVNIEFIESNLNPTVGTASNLYLGTISFNVVGDTGGGTSPITIFFDEAFGGIFSVNNVNVGDTVSLVNADGTLTVPEPAAAALALGALGTVGALARRKRRR